LDPDDLATNLNLGKYFLEKGNVDGALDHLRRATVASPDHARAHHLYGLALHFSGDAPAALVEFETSRRDPDFVSGLPAFQLHYGRALRDVGRYDDARDPLERYVASNPGDPLGFFELGQLELIAGDRSQDRADYVRAERAFLTSLTLDPMFAEAHRTLALVYRKLERYEEAAEEMAIYERLRT
ncbi:MAG: tetratricopeptide repeat protein, partial [Blastocatellia bacterium]